MLQVEKESIVSYSVWNLMYFRKVPTWWFYTWLHQMKFLTFFLQSSTTQEEKVVRLSSWEIRVMYTVDSNEWLFAFVCINWLINYKCRNLLYAKSSNPRPHIRKWISLFGVMDCNVTLINQSSIIAEDLNAFIFELVMSCRQQTYLYIKQTFKKNLKLSGNFIFIFPIILSLTLLEYLCIMHQSK